MDRRVVVTGLGPVTAVGTGREEYWKGLLAGRSGVGTIDSFPLDDYPCRFGGVVRDFDPERWLGKKEARHLDRNVQFAVAGAQLAVEDAGLDLQKIDPSRGGVILGSGIGGIGEMEEQKITLLEEGPRRVSPFTIPKLMANAMAGVLSIRFGLQGSNYVIASACASAGHAVGLAYDAIRAGREDLVLTGGAEAPITPLGMSGFGALRALSRRNDAPEKASRPFDAGRDGFVVGEGAGILVLEELEHARKRGARIWAEVLGYGCTADAHHITAPNPEGSGAARAMRSLLEHARIAPERVDYVNAHGTSTPAGDKAETLAIKAAFGGHARKLAVSSTKSMVGHLLGASGGVELIATVLSTAEDVVHPTINYETPDPECDLDYVPNTARQTKVSVAISSSFGFGGHNVTVAVGKFVG